MVSAWLAHGPAPLAGRTDQADPAGLAQPRVCEPPATARAPVQIARTAQATATARAGPHEPAHALPAVDHTVQVIPHDILHSGLGAALSSTFSGSGPHSHPLNAAIGLTERVPT